MHAHLLSVQSEAECKEENGLKLVGSSRKGGLVGRSENGEGNGLKLIGTNKKVGLIGRSENGVTDQVKDLHTWSSRHSSVEVSDCFAATLVSSFFFFFWLVCV